MERRKDDPIIDAIHVRLDTLESISADIAEIKEWISTVVKVTRMLEIMGSFMARWAVIFAKITGGVGLMWAMTKFGVTELVGTIKGWVGK